MFLECNNHEAHGPTDYHAYMYVHMLPYPIFHVQSSLQLAGECY